jgi:fumarate reductase flavoprotein subunit
MNGAQTKDPGPRREQAEALPPADCDFDVVIVGGGGSGLAAAVSAAEQGLRVAVLEKRPQLGGTTGIAIGALTANRTRQQRDQSIDDDPEAHNADAGRFAAPEIEARGNRELRGFFLEHTADTLAWLEGLGLAFHGPSPEPPNRVPRMHNVVPNAKAYIAALHRRLMQLGGVLLFEAHAMSLLREADDVVGVKFDHNGRQRELTADRGVVLAAGDYTSNSQMIAHYKGADFAAVEGVNPYSTGDGHKLAASVGGRLLNMDITYGPELRFVPPARQPFSQLLPSSGWGARWMGRLLPHVPQAIVTAMIKRLLVTWQHPEDSLFANGALLINQQSRRFCDEAQSPARENAVANQPGKLAYILLDEELADGYRKWPHFISTAPEIAYAYVDDYLRLRPDVAVEGDCWEQVAARRRLPERLTLNPGTCPPPRRESLGGRCVLLGPVKAYFTTTEGGAAIDRKFRVLDERGQPIRGLYAIGQTGLGGQVLWGHGLHIAWAMTSGRLVGNELARQRQNKGDD